MCIRDRFYLQRARQHPTLSIKAQDLNALFLVVYALRGDRKNYEAFLASHEIDPAKKELIAELLADQLSKGHQLNLKASSPIQAEAIERFEIELRLPESKPMQPVTLKTYGVRSRVNRAKFPLTRKNIQQRWLRHSWLPAGRAQLNQDTLLYHSYQRLHVVDRGSGQPLWASRPDDEIAVFPSLNGRYGIYEPDLKSAEPLAYQTQMMFHNQLGRQVTVIQEHAFYIAGQSKLALRSLAYAGNQRQHHLYGNQLEIVSLKPDAIKSVRSLGGSAEYLVVKQGGHASKKKNPFHCVQFVSLPVAVEQDFIVAVQEKGNRLCLYRLNLEAVLSSDDPSRWVVWKKSLLEYPSTHTVLSTPATLRVRHGRVLISSSKGFVASYQVWNGQLDWIMRYPRIEAHSRTKPFNTPYPVYDQSWKMNQLLLIGDVVWVAPVDSDRLMAVDFESGRVIDAVKMKTQSEHPLALIERDESKVLALSSGSITAFHIEAEPFAAKQLASSWKF